MPSVPVNVGQTISHYRLLRKLGSGGMGVVYEAEDVNLARHVALKFLPDELSEDPQALNRFRWEARAASALNHPNICTVYEIGEVADQTFIAMELLEGKTLGEVLQGRPLPLEDVLDWSIQIAEALDAAHLKCVLHRDIKPGNIFLLQRGRVKLLDFGLAKPLLERRLAQSVDAPTVPLLLNSQHPDDRGLTLGTVLHVPGANAWERAGRAQRRFFLGRRVVPDEHRSIALYRRHDHGAVRYHPEPRATASRAIES
jgi:eukaryotic-like serine/threonine-protein kinase